MIVLYLLQVLTIERWTEAFEKLELIVGGNTYMYYFGFNFSVFYRDWNERKLFGTVFSTLIDFILVIMFEILIEIIDSGAMSSSSIKIKTGTSTSSRKC